MALEMAEKLSGVGFDFHASTWQVKAVALGLV